MLVLLKKQCCVAWSVVLCFVDELVAAGCRHPGAWWHCFACSMCFVYWSVGMLLFWEGARVFSDTWHNTAAQVHAQFTCKDCDDIFYYWNCKGCWPKNWLALHRHACRSSAASDLLTRMLMPNEPALAREMAMLIGSCVIHNTCTSGDCTYMPVFQQSISEISTKTCSVHCTGLSPVRLEGMQKHIC